MSYAADEKRTALLEAATRLLHERGLHRTTLADVAVRAEVPLGNVYYYFKTKDALALAVMAAHESALRERFASWTVAHPDPRRRLIAFVRTPLEYADAVIQFGCPHGSLCQELEKLDPGAPLAKAGAAMMGAYLEWTEAQFRALGHRPREARARASDLVAAVQGTLLLAHTLRSPEFLTRQIRRIEQSLTAPTTTTERPTRSP